jgi:hypothetical protein
MGVAIYWPDGAVTRAETASEALEIVATKQWEQPMTVDSLKFVLAARAYGWNQASVNPLLPDDEFLAALGETGMVFVTDDRIEWREPGELD